jgi:hypothetical protein
MYASIPITDVSRLLMQIELLPFLTPWTMTGLQRCSSSIMLLLNILISAIVSNPTALSPLKVFLFIQTYGPDIQLVIPADWYYLAC